MQQVDSVWLEFYGGSGNDDCIRGVILMHQFRKEIGAAAFQLRFTVPQKFAVSLIRIAASSDSTLSKRT